MKRSAPMKRTPFRREGPSLPSRERPLARDTAKRSTLTAAPSRCKHCRGKFTAEERARALRLHPACEAGFAEAYAAKLRKNRERAERAREKADRADTRKRREAMKTIPELIAEADRAFMAWVRERDRQAGYPCISSGRPLDWSGNQVDAGHYRSRGAASHLRYDPRNCHAQSKYENRHRAGNAVEYRIGLIQRIGLAEVEALEADNRVHHWTREELEGIKATYRAKLRELKRTKETA